MRDISTAEALKRGIYTKYSEMDNGEFRYRLVGSDNSAYIRTEATKACWQNSHYHKCCYESYIVQKGTIYFCEFKDDILSVKKLQAGECIVSQPYIAHNIYMCDDTVTHTVKFGDCDVDDWYTAEYMDDLTLSLNLSDLERLSV